MVEIFFKGYGSKRMFSSLRTWYDKDDGPVIKLILKIKQVYKCFIIIIILCITKLKNLSGACLFL